MKRYVITEVNILASFVAIGWSMYFPWISYSCAKAYSTFTLCYVGLC